MDCVYLSMKMQIAKLLPYLFWVFAISLTINLVSCDEEEIIDAEKYVTPVVLTSSKENSGIELKWHVPFILFDAASNIYNRNAIPAERYELYGSESDTTNFTRIGEVSLVDNIFTYPDSENDTDYFFTIKSSARGANPTFSNIVWVRGGSNTEPVLLVNFQSDNSVVVGDLSADDEKIIYSKRTSQQCCDSIDLFSYHFTTESETLLGKHIIQPSLNSSENKIAFVSGFGDAATSQQYNLGVLDLSTDQQSQLTFGDNIIQHPVWSSDDKSIFYLIFNEDLNNHWEIHRFSIEEETTTTLVSANGMFVGNGPISYVNKTEQIAFSAADENGIYDLYLLDINTNAISELEQSRWNEYNPAISPNGQYLAFIADRSGREEIWVKDLPNGSYFQLTSNVEGYPQGRLLWTSDNRVFFKGNYQEMYGIFSIDFNP